ncbi:hypothetical protein GCM10010317_086740 [Streptomyces mirabilis]|uniref:hypothetical protein n=1 Tax=Streptomyces mirabilis TaxID=68239 RepID=UPI00167E9009|nr:hypothetical protein [Streptomyces mirabilis]GHD74100.1 hypothetical protein GCM10010317_086740 [Streptomyces mirabilis]
MIRFGGHPRSGVQPREVAKDIDPAETAVPDRGKQAEVDAGERDGPTSSEREELAALRREDRRLREGTVESIEPKVFGKVRDTNLTGPCLGTRATAPSMRTTGAGSIADVSSSQASATSRPRRSSGRVWPRPHTAPASGALAA